MKTKTIKVLIFIILLIAGSAALSLTAFVYIAGKNGTIFMTTVSEREEEPVYKVTCLGLEKIGDSYTETLRDGSEVTYYADSEEYAIYGLDLEVTNLGLEEAYSEEPDLEFQGQEWDDARMIWTDSLYYEEEPLFYGSDKTVLPAQQSVNIRKYVQIKNGVSEFTVSYYADSDWEEQVSFTVLVTE